MCVTFWVISLIYLARTFSACQLELRTDVYILFRPQREKKSLFFLRSTHWFFQKCTLSKILLCFFLFFKFFEPNWFFCFCFGRCYIMVLLELVQMNNHADWVWNSKPCSPCSNYQLVLLICKKLFRILYLFTSNISWYIFTSL